jgi:MoxR-like ATPase
MLKILVDYPLHDEELTVVHRSLASTPELPQVLGIDELRALQKTVDHVYVDPALVTYSVKLASASRNPGEVGLDELAPYLSFGASPRGPISLIRAARALAVLRGRDYVLPADVDELAKDALRHRLVLSYEALAEERTPDSILDALVEAVTPPPIDLSTSTAA